MWKQKLKCFYAIIEIYGSVATEGGELTLPEGGFRKSFVRRVMLKQNSNREVTIYRAQTKEDEGQRKF